LSGAEGGRAEEPNHDRVIEACHSGIPHISFARMFCHLNRGAGNEIRSPSATAKLQGGLRLDPVTAWPTPNRGCVTQSWPSWHERLRRVDCRSREVVAQRSAHGASRPLWRTPGIVSFLNP
jgi:type II secretory pathway pseudopilin PulG